MRNLLILFLIGSKFYLIFAFYNISSPILLPLLCMPLGIRVFDLLLRQGGEKNSVAESSKEKWAFPLDL